ncbi:beta-lactamase-like protein [Biscogniauxia marginata]|nr:beta-lactamase-like protein [Biscogniauxia marginata]
MMTVVEIPPSSATVTVSIINTGWATGIPCTTWFKPRFEGLDTFDLCSYAFLVTHDDGARRRRVLFDMGIRRDWENIVPIWQQIFSDHGVEVKVERDVADILTDNGIALDDVEAMVWSHLHWDHIGNPAKFPPTTKLVVGPGFKEAFMPGWPTNLRAEFKQEDVAGRTIVEIEKSQFDESVGGFPGYDYFGDGSFFLLDAPGHVTGHINALARTTADPESFIFMAADSVHFSGEFRPSALLPLPDRVEKGAPPLPRPCPGSLLLGMHPKQSTVEPFLILGTSFPENLAEADETIRYLQEFDADGRVLVIFAHDDKIEGYLPRFPEPANDWMRTGVKEGTRWAFLSDLYKIAKGMGGERTSW